MNPANLDRNTNPFDVLSDDIIVYILRLLPYNEEHYTIRPNLGREYKLGLRLAFLRENPNSAPVDIMRAISYSGSEKYAHCSLDLIVKANRLDLFFAYIPSRNLRDEIICINTRLFRFDVVAHRIAEHDRLQFIQKMELCDQLRGLVISSAIAYKKIRFLEYAHAQHWTLTREHFQSALKVSFREGCEFLHSIGIYTQECDVTTRGMIQFVDDKGLKIAEASLVSALRSGNFDISVLLLPRFPIDEKYLTYALSYSTRMDVFCGNVIALHMLELGFLPSPREFENQMRRRNFGFVYAAIDAGYKLSESDRRNAPFFSFNFKN